MRSLSVLILAAGKGTRMRSALAKALHPVAGVPMVRYAVALAKRLRPARILVVVGHQAAAVQAVLRDPGLRFVEQRPLLGTGHAVAAARSQWGKRGTLLILSADTPLLRADTVRSLLTTHERTRATITFLTARLEDPSGYGRVLRDPRGAVLRIVEQRDAAPAEARVGEVNAGLYAVEAAFLHRAVRELGNRNAQREYYLTSVVEKALQAGRVVSTCAAPRGWEVLGVNTRAELARATGHVLEETRQRLMREGVTFLLPQASYVEASVRVGKDSVLGPFTVLTGDTVLGERCVVEAGAVLRDATLGDDVTIRSGSVLAGCRVGDRSTIGPMSHLRPETRVAEDVRVGNFVEVKQSTLAPGVRASHLTYLGDAVVGPGVNVGAGTITCNYDGFAKHVTVIEEGAFIGSDVQLVAPVRVGRHAIVGAGSTITTDVPAKALAVSRARQTVIPDYHDGWARRGRIKARGA